MRHWLELANRFSADYAAVISLGTLVFVVLYTAITAWILRTALRQTEGAVCPVLTADPLSLRLAGDGQERLSPVSRSIFLRNTGSGPALNICIIIYTDKGGALFPRLRSRTFPRAESVPVNATIDVTEFWYVIRDSPALQTYENQPDLSDNFEILVRYRSLHGRGYLTRVVFGVGETPGSRYGRDRVARQWSLWLGMWWRHFWPSAKAWVRVLRRKQGSQG